MTTGDSSPAIAVIAAGAMGSALAARMVARGATVLTPLAGRSQATRARARAAGMTEADLETIVARADAILSIVPPAEAPTLAATLAPLLAASVRKPVFADCNAVNVETVRAIAATLAPTGAGFVDAALIGFPPATPDAAGPVLYLSGPDADRLAVLGALGLRIKTVAGPVGAASALKMSYGGITKGLVALGAAMVLAAGRAGAAPALFAELADSQPQLLARFAKTLPDMVPKAYRWVAEMREIAGFLAEDPAAAAMFEGAARFYERIAADAAGDRQEIARLEAFFS